MISDLFFYQLVLIALVWLCVMLHWGWPGDHATVHPTPPRKHRREPKPFEGLTTKPHCDACAHASDPGPQAPASPATAYRHDARTTTSDRHVAPFLS